MTEDEIVNLVLEKVKRTYDIEHKKLYDIGAHSQTEGEIRDAAGRLVENILQSIFDTIDMIIPEARIESKVGHTDFLSKEVQYKGKIYIFGRIQVDRHILSKGVRIAFIENKTYLDSCYFDRALADFRKIAQALYQQDIDPADVEYIVFAGQDAAKQETLLVYEVDFWSDTKSLTQNPNGIEPKRFYFLKGKRQSAKPLFKIKHELNNDSIKDFTKFILNLL
jgi:hypothetical protein